LPIVALFSVFDVRAQEQAAKERSTGLPQALNWTFNIDAGLGAFGFNDSLYRDQRADPSGDLSDNWFEGYVKPALSAEFPKGNSTFFSKASVIGTRTFSAPPTLVGDDASSFDVEDLYVGWRSGTALGSTEDMLSLTLGRAPYELGHGLLISDGAGDGGSRGGFWSGARKAWEEAGIGRLKIGPNQFDVFYLDRDELPENNTHTKLYGANYELAFADRLTFGLSYLRPDSDLELRDDMDVYNARLYTTPLLALPGLSFEFEYALEDNGDAFKSDAWYAQAAYKFDSVSWKPQLSYRYAFFEGDDPSTAKNESFDMLFPGFYDWGTWWQGEIAGEYFLANSNLKSHQVHLRLTPSEKLSGGVIGYFFELDQPTTFAPGVTSKDIGYETDLYVDWALNDNFSASFVLAYADPDDAIAQTTGRTSHLEYAMVYLSYSY
jgi:hypothetical protein